MNKKVAWFLAIVFFIFAFTYVWAGNNRITEQNKTYLKDSASGFKIGLQPPSLSSSWNFTLPTTAGSLDRYLKTNGFGLSSWADINDQSANRNLSNLLSPTSVNQDLIPSSGTLNLGSSASPWSSLKTKLVEFWNVSLSNKISLKAPDSLAIDQTYNLPVTDGTSGQAIITDGAGNLSFSTISGGGGGGGVNEYLSNLLSPTAVNQSLLSSSGDKYGINFGSNLIPFGSMTAKGITFQAFGNALIERNYSTGIGGVPDCAPGNFDYLNSNTRRIAQTYTMVANHRLQQVSQILTKQGTMTGVMFMEVYATSGGLPTGSPIATSNPQIVTNIDTTQSNRVIYFIFHTNVTLASGTKYAFVLNSSKMTFTTGSMQIVGSSGVCSKPDYVGGEALTYDGATWSASTGDDYIGFHDFTPNNHRVTYTAGPRVSSTGSWIAPSTVNDTTFFLPTTDGTTGQVLTTDGFGSLSFASVNIPATGNPAGAIIDYAGTNCPTGYYMLDGSSKNTTSDAALFAAIGYTYGGAGANFNMPDMRGRVSAGKDDMGGAAANRLTAAGSGITGTTLGNAGGAQNVTISVAQLPVHNHDLASHQHNWGGYWSNDNSNDIFNGNGDGVGNTYDDSYGYWPANGFYNNGGNTQSANHTHNVTIIENNIGGGGGYSYAAGPYPVNHLVVGTGGNIGSHYHTQRQAAHRHWIKIRQTNTISNNTSGNAGSGSSTSIVQPTIIFNKCIKY